MAAKVFILILSSVTCRYNQQKALKIACRVYLVYWCLIVLLRPLDLKVQQSKIDHRSSASTAMMFECLAYSGVSSILIPRLITDHVTPFYCEHTVRLLVKFFLRRGNFQIRDSTWPCLDKDLSITSHPLLRRPRPHQ